MYIVYILKSLSSGRYYIGCTGNIKKRLIEHNGGRVSSTKAFVPWEIVYTEKFDDRSQAFQREKVIKSYKSGVKFKRLVTSVK